MALPAGLPLWRSQVARRVLKLGRALGTVLVAALGGRRVIGPRRGLVSHVEVSRGWAPAATPALSHAVLDTLGSMLGR